MDTSQPEAPQSQRLVVDSRYEKIVTDALGALGLTTQETPHAGLGLTLIDPFLGGESVDPLLAELRRRFALDNGGWVPTMGKDRTATSPSVTGGHSQPMAHGLTPEPAEPEDDRSTGGSDPMPATGAPGPRIGLIDVPKAATLQPSPDAPPEPWQAHSRFVMELIARAAPTAPEPILVDALREGGGKGNLWDVATAMVDLVLEHQVDILVLPLACYTADGLPPLLLSRAVERIAGKTLIIAAAGNQLAQFGWLLGRCPDSTAWPGAFPDVQSVSGDFWGGVDEPRPRWLDAITAESSFTGEFFTGPVLTAESVTQTYEGHVRWAGTSFCAAHAAGLVAGTMARTGLTAVAAWNALLNEGTALRRPPGSEEQ